MQLDGCFRETKHEQGADCVHVRYSYGGGEGRVVIVGAERNRSNRGHNILQYDILSTLQHRSRGERRHFTNVKFTSYPNVWVVVCNTVTPGGNPKAEGGLQRT